MKLPSPKLPAYDVAAWSRLPFPERVKLVCQSWAVDGYGIPWPVYVAYLLKVGLYVAGFLFTCARSSRLGPPSTFATWWFESEALERALLFSMAFEGLGLGCGSGPLTARYVPPFGGFLYFSRPGTLKRPIFPRLPLLGGAYRTWFDVALYVAHLALLARALLAPAITPAYLLPIVVVFPFLALADRTLYLASRAEHYFTALLCFLVPGDTLSGLKLVWLAVWIFAATSKVNRHFPAVVCVMTSNSAILRMEWLRKRLYVSYPDDLRPSPLAHAMAHTGTCIEYLFPILLVSSHGGVRTLVGLAIMASFHFFITSNIPVGVPIEWNVIMVYGAFVLFGHHAAVPTFAIQSLPLASYLFVVLLVLPIVGNFFPEHVSFLVSMRYYAGNWPYGIWLFRGDSVKKLDRLEKSSPLVEDQLARFYDRDTITVLLSKVMAFRSMHVQGRALRELVPRAVDDPNAYAWFDGEVICGIALGWNFGDGHLHDETFLAAVQQRCGFEEGELRVIFVESQPMFRPHVDYRIADAKSGELARGRIPVDRLLEGQPWAT